jgi:putative transcriptional regulator
MNLEKLRKNAGLRVEEVAAFVGVSHSTVYNSEQGRTIPKLRIDQFKTLINLYKCDFEQLWAAVETTSKGKESARLLATTESGIAS